MELGSQFPFSMPVGGRSRITDIVVADGVHDVAMRGLAMGNIQDTTTDLEFEVLCNSLPGWHQQHSSHYLGAYLSGLARTVSAPSTFLLSASQNESSNKSHGPVEAIASMPTALEHRKRCYGKHPALQHCAPMQQPAAVTAQRQLQEQSTAVRISQRHPLYAGEEGASRLSTCAASRDHPPAINPWLISPSPSSPFPLPGPGPMQLPPLLGGPPSSDAPFYNHPHLFNPRADYIENNSKVHGQRPLSRQPNDVLPHIAIAVAGSCSGGRAFGGNGSGGDGGSGGGSYSVPASYFSPAAYSHLSEHCPSGDRLVSCSSELSLPSPAEHPSGGRAPYSECCFPMRLSSPCWGEPLGGATTVDGLLPPQQHPQDPTISSVVVSPVLEPGSDDRPGCLTGIIPVASMRSCAWGLPPLQMLMGLGGSCLASGAIREEENARMEVMGGEEDRDKGQEVAGGGGGGQEDMEAQSQRGASGGVISSSGGGGESESLDASRHSLDGLIKETLAEDEALEGRADMGHPVEAAVVAVELTGEIRAGDGSGISGAGSGDGDIGFTCKSTYSFDDTPLSSCNGVSPARENSLTLLAMRFRNRPGRVPKAVSSLGPIAELAKNAATGRIRLDKEALDDLVVTVETNLARALTEQKEDNRARNRVAQQRFRNRQKDTIVALQAKVVKQEALIAVLYNKIKLYETSQQRPPDRSQLVQHQEGVTTAPQRG